MSRLAVAYVNDDGDIWIERGSAPWPQVQHEAATMARDIGGFDSVSFFEGIVEGVRVSDEREAPHMDEEGAECQKNGCCRTIIAYHFRSVEPR